MFFIIQALYVHLSSVEKKLYGIPPFYMASEESGKSLVGMLKPAW
jgi:hypothetical protein